MPLDSALTTALLAAAVSIGTILLTKSKCIADLGEHGPFEHMRIGFLDNPLRQDDDPPEERSCNELPEQSPVLQPQQYYYYIPPQPRPTYYYYPPQVRRF